ncbi:bifunctional riboflavin kinase/FAD synthetase [Allobranchiibius sp. GilTou73]|uniref:bifunctional riboflavin kinase/FAD synthetase n=1 Tax=unclassified Allobranchiibius TaxID=2649857 RepID=UPI001AA18CD5|nr:bifunctional riboflavin kinase/FAD synthetase [Allobranchiibius sp. GilTou73]MBO1765260.1 bifunctional riboflavin kinase/FAD synthetase [Allobranchiibius sp. GilTou38]UIJ34410.1 bifunctional riboflavin kinase/FAD synthetase [Allobranchiibius sp. GilTou73]
MLRLTETADLPSEFGPSVVTIGNFDGVHLGHRTLLAAVVQRAQREGLASVAVTFEPHPLAVLHPDHAPVLVSSLEDRLATMEQIGLDAVLVMPFTLELAAMSPRDFVREVFVDGLRAHAVVVGRDTRFGARNEGDVDTLRELGAEFGFEVQVQEDVGEGGRYSSTEVRSDLVAGDVAAASRILGRPHAVTGMVVRGAQRGRELGYPTANLAQDATGFVPADGVYAGWLVRIQHGGERLPAAISVGTNPTFDGTQRTVEAYVLDRTDLDLYDEVVAVEFTDRLRSNVRFDSIEPLIEQMGHDVDRARTLLTGQ